MTQENKEILLKDLCARLPYGVKVHEDIQGNFTLIGLTDDRAITNCEIENCYNKFPIDIIKPYLFPLSSMTKDQKKEISKRYNYYNFYGLCIKITNHSEGYWDNDNSCNLQDYLWLIDWFNKNHFDYSGLIEKGLAIDCTNLNIY